MLRGIKKRGKIFSSPKDMLDVSKQSSAAVFPQAHACFTGFSMRPCGTTPVINTSFGIDKTIRKLICFLELFVPLFHYTFSLLKRGKIFSSLPCLVISYSLPCLRLYLPSLPPCLCLPCSSLSLRPLPPS